MTEQIARAFVAVVPPAPVLDAVGRVVASAGAVPSGWRWVPREQWHLTLQFLGRVADADAVVAALAAATSSQPAFDARLGGAGAFPSARRAGVAWTGVVEGAEELSSLEGSVGSALEVLGYEREQAAFHPHVTLARARGRERRDARELVDALDAPRVGEPFRVDEVVLFESRTRPSGAEHVARARFPLPGGRRS